MVTIIWLRLWKRACGLGGARRPVRRTRPLGRVEALEDRTTPTVTINVFGNTLEILTNAANDQIYLGGTDVLGSTVVASGTGAAPRTVPNVFSISIRDTSNGGFGGAGAGGQSVVFQDIGAGRISLSNTLTVDDIDTVTFSNPTHAVFANAGISITDAQQVTQTNAVPQLLTPNGRAVRITAGAIGTAANPLRILGASGSLETNTSTGNGNQYFDLGGNNGFLNVDGGGFGPVEAGTGTVTVTNGRLIGAGANDFSDATTFNLGSGGGLTVRNTEAIGGLSGTGAVTAFTGPSTLAVGGTGATTTFGGTLADGTDGGTLSLTKRGAGALILASASTYTGGTTVSNGQLLYYNGSALGTGTVTLGDGSTPNGARPALIAAAATNTTLANAIQSNVSGAIVGSVDDPRNLIPNFSGPISTNVGTLTLQGGSNDRTTFTGRITGPGSITATATAAGRRVVLATPANSNDFAGGVTIGAGAVLHWAGASGSSSRTPRWCPSPTPGPTSGSSMSARPSRRSRASPPGPGWCTRTSRT